ncbi:MAG TPA: acyl-CoA dehydrogenase, partial [Gammaproteobacteria bacterium]|nr:acyl-CoA dehydrogenase [Gammaproteobacteria bacterium]
MDLSFGPEYEEFRQEVRDFIDKNRTNAPRGEPMKSEKVKDWQKLLIEKGYTARTI